MDVYTLMLLKWSRVAYELIECNWMPLQTTSNAAVQLRAKGDIFIFNSNINSTSPQAILYSQLSGSYDI